MAGDQLSADLYHWSAMEFGEHWLQRLSLVLARGQGDLVLEAVKTARKNHRGRDGGRGASAEWSQTVFRIDVCTSSRCMGCLAAARGC